MKPSISINIITKDQPEALDKCLESVYKTLFEEGDEAVILDTGSSFESLKRNEEVVSQYRGARLLYRPDLAKDFVPLLKRWMPERVEEFTSYYPDGKLITNFAEARQIAQEVSKNDLIFWIDTDDVLVEEIPGQFRNCINELLNPEDPKVDAIFLDYRYAFDPDGTCITTLRRERVFFRDRYSWAGRCHETAFIRKTIAPRNVAYVEALKVYIQHTDARKPPQFSDMRNYCILRQELEEMEIPDPRTVFYLANACRGLGLFKESISLYHRFNRLSGSSEDRFNAWYYVASIYMDGTVRRPIDAREAYWECLKIKTDDPRPYFGLARVAAAMKKYRESLMWYERGLKFSIPNTQMHSYDPTHVSYHPHVIASTCSRELEEPDACLEQAARAARARPDYAQAREIYGAARNFGAAMMLTNSFGVILNNLKFGGPNAIRVAREVCAELRAIPQELEKRGVGKVEPPDPRPQRPELAIFCGTTPHEWGPTSRAAGLGGSEKMVIILGEALQRRGVNVSVYANVPLPERGVDEKTGVWWRHWAEFDEKRPRDVFVAWRNPTATVAVKCPARVRMVWNHDVQNPGRYTEDVLAATDFVQFQSEAHTEGCETLPKDKIWVARNAVEVVEGSRFVSPIKKQKLVAYCSSPDRGLLTACEVVERARKHDPEISLVVTYGFPEWARVFWANNNHPFIPDLGHEASVDVYEQDVYRALDRINAQVLHKVGFDVMEDLWNQAGVWLYPTRFLEISCMAAMEAQAHGCIPVATRHHALKETILPQANLWRLDTPPISLSKYDAWLDDAALVLANAVNVALDDPVREDLAKAAIEKYNVDDLATLWIKKLGLSTPSAKGGRKGLIKKDKRAVCSARAPLMRSGCD